MGFEVTDVVLSKDVRSLIAALRPWREPDPEKSGAREVAQVYSSLGILLLVGYSVLCALLLLIFGSEHVLRILVPFILSLGPGTLKLGWTLAQKRQTVGVAAVCVHWTMNALALLLSIFF